MRICRLMMGALLACTLSGGCGGSSTGWPEEGYPPEEPRQPQRLVVTDSTLTDQLAWWRVNILSLVPTETYASAEWAQAAGEVVSITNAIRAEYGLEPVELMPQLSRVAQAHAIDQGTRDYWSHTTPEGLGSHERIEAADGSLVTVGGENSTIADPGSHTPSQIVYSWLRHTGHRELLLNPDVKYIGVGVYSYSSEDWLYYVQLLVSFD